MKKSVRLCFKQKYQSSANAFYRLKFYVLCVITTNEINFIRQFSGTIQIFNVYRELHEMKDSLKKSRREFILKGRKLIKMIKKVNLWQTRPEIDGAK